MHSIDRDHDPPSFFFGCVGVRESSSSASTWAALRTFDDRGRPLLARQLIPVDHERSHALVDFLPRGQRNWTRAHLSPQNSANHAHRIHSARQLAHTGGTGTCFLCHKIPEPTTTVPLAGNISQLQWHLQLQLAVGTSRCCYAVALHWQLPPATRDSFPHPLLFHC